MPADPTEDNTQTEFFECTCRSDEHTLKFSLDPDDGELYTSVYLHQYRSVFKRIGIALKYVLGYLCRFGHWDCFILKPQDADRLIALLQQFQQQAGTQKNQGSTEVT